MRMKLRPIRDEVYVRVVQEAAVRGGIHVPESYVKKSRQGVVLAVGPRCQGDVVPGDTVLLPEYIKRSVQHEVNGPVFNLVSESEIIGIVEA